MTPTWISKNGNNRIPVVSDNYLDESHAKRIIGAKWREYCQ